MRTATPFVTCRSMSDLREVGDVAADFEAAVHGAGVEDEGVGLGGAEGIAGDAEQDGCILAGGREKGAGLAL